MTTVYVAHVHDEKGCHIEGVQIMFHCKGYDQAFELFAETNEYPDNAEIHVFRFDFDRMEQKSNGFFGKFKGWKPFADVEFESEIALDAVQDNRIELSQAEISLRKLWTEKGVSQDKQDQLIADITAKAQPKALAGMFPMVAGEGAPQYAFDIAPESQLSLL